MPELDLVSTAFSTKWIFEEKKVFVPVLALPYLVDSLTIIVRKSPLLSPLGPGASAIPSGPGPP